MMDPTQTVIRRLWLDMQGRGLFSQWETDFLQSCFVQRRELSEKQRRVLARLIRRAMRAGWKRPQEIGTRVLCACV